MPETTPTPAANPLANPMYPSALPPGAGERYVRAFTDQLLASGVHHVVICPGSRSTPLTLVFARDGRWRSWLHIDERSAGYFALGLARQLGEPVALVCSSGTAAANFLPAVVEASLSRVPLLVLTADRPPELRDVGAPQTIDQVRMFGSHARWAIDMTPADGSEALERSARGVAARAAATSMAAPSGPVHMNFPFREPLVERQGVQRPPAGRAIAVTRSEAAPSDAAVQGFVEAARGRRGLVIAGPEAGGLPAIEVAAVASALGWPVLADPLSGLRAGTHDLEGVIEAYDVLTRVGGFIEEHTPEVTLRFGGAPTSKALNVWLGAHPEIDSWVVDVEGQWREPDATVSTMLRGEAEPVCRAVLGALTPGDRVAGDWIEGWRNANAIVGRALREATEALDEPFEGRVPVELAEALSGLPAGATMVVGNSMPVRDVDTFFPRLAGNVRIEGTRGASGIDGVVSTAVGAAAAGRGPVVLLIGDLSFLHDLNGLWAVNRHRLDLTIVLVNNDGGGIFHFLPQAELAPDAFEEWWGTPHGLDLGLAVALHGGHHVRLEGPRGWATEIAAALARPGLQVLELRTERFRNVELHRDVIARASSALTDAHARARAAAGAGATS